MLTADIILINRSHHPDPAYATPGSSGMDIHAYLPEKSVVIKPRQRALIPTGLYMQIPEGFEVQVRPRSGLSLNRGLTVANTPGTVDSDYRGEICVILLNVGDEDITIDDGERVAQIVVAPVVRAVFRHGESLDKTERGDGAFGHTGV